MSASLRVGLTGGIGSGKSTVARLLREHGALVIDADAIAREVTAPGTSGHDAVVAAFGPAVTDAAGRIDRGQLAAIVFTDDAARKRLEAIVHPLVRADRQRTVAAAPDGSVVVEDVPLLAEAGLAAGYDVVVVVEAPEAVRLTRLQDRGMSADEARSRMASQATDEQRRALSHIVIDNAGSFDVLADQVATLWSRLQVRAAVDNAHHTGDPA